MFWGSCCAPLFLVTFLHLQLTFLQPSLINWRVLTICTCHICPTSKVISHIFTNLILRGLFTVYFTWTFIIVTTKQVQSCGLQLLSQHRLIQRECYSFWKTMFDGLATILGFFLSFLIGLKCICYFILFSG